MGHHHQGHCHHHPKPTSHFAFAFAVGINLLFTLIEAYYAIMANSTGLLADAGHNLGDVLSLAFAWLALYLLKRPANVRYSYGYKRVSILAALCNGVVLLLSAALITVDAIRQLLHPNHVNEMIVIATAAIGIVVNGVAALLFLRHKQQDLNLRGAFLHLAYDALISFGVVVSGIIMLFTHWYWLDPIVGLGIVVTIILGTWHLLTESVSLLLDGVPANIDPKAVVAYLNTIDGVEAVHDVHIWSLSTQEVALTAHLVMPEKHLDDTDHRQLNHEMNSQFNIHHITLQVERGTLTDPCGREGCC